MFQSTAIIAELCAYAAMSASSVSDELDARLSLALDPFEDMCAPKSHTTIPSFKVTDLSWQEDAARESVHMQHLVCSQSTHML